MKMIKRRIKKTVVFLLSITIMITLVGCSAKNDVTDIDITDLSNELLENAEFEDELSADIVNIGLHFFLKNVRPYAASCSEA